MTLLLMLGILTLITLLIASYTDIKTREVPDWISYGLLFAAIGIRFLFSIETADWNILIAGLLGFAPCFLLALIFYYTNQWGGADSKLLMAIGAIIGITYPLDNTSFTLLFFFLLLLLVGAIYGILWILGIAIKNHTTFKKHFIKRVKDSSYKHIFAIILTGLILYTETIVPGMWPFAIFPLPLLYIFLLITIAEDHYFTKSIPLSKLTEGDWLAEDVKQNNKLILKKKTILQKDITFLQKKHINNITIKEGIPFVPSFLFAYLSTFILQLLQYTFQNIFI